MSLFFEGANRPRPAKDFAASPTGYQERHHGGPDGARSVVGYVTWPLTIANRYFGRANVALSESILKSYIQNVPVQDAYTARNGVQSRTIQYEPGQPVMLQYRSNGTTNPIITGSVNLSGNWDPFVEDGVIYGVDDLIEDRPFAPAPSSALPTIVNNEWWGTWTIGALRGMRDVDPINGNDAQVGMIPGPLTNFIDPFGNTADLMFSHEETLEFGDDARTQGHLDGISPRALENAKLSVRHAQSELERAIPARVNYSQGPFEKVEDNLLPNKRSKQGRQSALRLLESSNEQLQEALDVAETHEKWILAYPLEYVTRIIEHWGYLDGLGVNKIAEHVPPALTLSARSRFGGYDIPPPEHAGDGMMSINFAKGPGPDVTINRYETYKTASPLPPVSIGDTVASGGDDAQSESAGAALAVPQGRTPFMHIVPKDNDLNITHRPEDSLSVYLAAMGIEHSRYIVDFTKQFFDEQNLFALLSGLTAALGHRNRLVFAAVQRELGQDLYELVQQVELFLGRPLPACWRSVLEAEKPLVALAKLGGLNVTDPWVMLEGKDAVISWLAANNIDPLARLLVEGRALDFFSELCGRSTGVPFATYVKEQKRLCSIVKRALRIPVLGDALL